MTDEGDGVLELKNLAVEPAFQGKGYGKTMMDFLARTYKEQYTVLQVGTGDSPSTIRFMNLRLSPVPSAQKRFHRPL